MVGRGAELWRNGWLIQVPVNVGKRMEYARKQFFDNTFQGELVLDGYLIEGHAEALRTADRC
jgi:hypothetical protein